MGKIVAAVQSNYIPWKGYFDLINFSDEFILYDDVQYTTKDWRNRNKIKTHNGLIWMTIPVRRKGHYHQKICETIVSDTRWNRKHWNSIVTNYSRARYFSTYRQLLEDLYLNCDERFLSQINYRFITAICQLLGINTKISWVMDYHLVEKEKNDRIIELCTKTQATDFLIGPAGRSYISEDGFRQEGIGLKFMDYSDYPKYGQLFPPFEHGVSIIDLILNEGPNASKYLKSFQGNFLNPSGEAFET